MSMMGKALAWLTDLLFPIYCISCKTEGSWLCQACFPKNTTLENYAVEAVEGKSYLDGLTAFFRYGENPASELLRMLKYRYITGVLAELRQLIVGVSGSAKLEDFIIMAVPLHPRRERERGFNQAEHIASLFSEKLGFPIHQYLFRKIYTKQQAKLSGEERRKNLSEAFVFRGDRNSVPKKVLLVDDVFTTGSTMQECAKVLKNSGVQTVWGMVLAKD